jgi:uncharacterized repeat protein (TIGR01451 family)
MINKNIAFSLLSIVVLATLFVRPVQADVCNTSYGSYGNSTNCQPSDLTINKQVYNPVGKVYVENMTTTDHTFKPGTEVTFRLTIKNGSGETFNPVNVRDTLPPYLEFVSGPGTYNKDTRELEFKLENMIAGESRTVEILTRVVAAEQFPTGKSLFCVTNIGNVSALNRRDSDTAQVCLQNGEVVRNLPVAGFNDLMLLLPMAGVGLGGLALLKGKKRG